MVNTFTNPVLGKAAELGLSFYEDTEPVELRDRDSIETLEIVVQAVYRQVLGNSYVMESERLTVPESQFKNGSITVREFVRQVARSGLYKSRFFDNCPRYRSIELNFKHLLGRAPDSYQETNAHSQILDREGYAAEINAYIDSEEYQNNFGENIVPYYRGYKTQIGKNVAGFTRIFPLLRGASSSDKKLTTKDKARLTSSLINNRPSAIIPPSNSDSYGGVTDINKLLAKVFSSDSSKPTAASSTTPAVRGDGQNTGQSIDSSSTTKDSSNLEQKIGTLRQQLASLSSTATIGASQLGQWQSSQSAVKFDSGSSQNSRTQQEIIADLESQIADARRLAAIGEARLNKWRRRTFT